jgi:signal transduction histidine kinase
MTGMSETRSKPADQVQSIISDFKIKNWLHSLGNGLYKIRPRFKDKHFWIVQFLIIVIAVVHDIIELGGYLHHLGVLYFVPVSLFFIPVVYAALYFGLAGSIATVIWAVIITIPNWIFWHEGLERIGVIFQMFLLFTVAIFAGRRVDREAEAKHKAEDASVLLGTYAAHILQGQEDERQRIARELHDQTLQTLSLMSQRLVSMEDKYSPLPSTVIKEVRQVQEMAEEATKDLRDFTRSIRPPILDDLGIVPSIRRLLIESTERTGMKGTFKLIGDERRLQQDIEVSIFRIIQEAIWNVERHSKATQVIVTMILNADETKIDVSDNGIGFEVPPMLSTFYADGKLGLLGMQERAKLIGGKLEIQSTPNTGTKISFQIT